VTAVVVDLAEHRLHRAAPAAVVTAVCVSLWRGSRCHGLLAYQGGRWLHIGVGCDDAQPATCQHPTCTQLAELDQPCAVDGEHCCGCCWIHADDLEGRQLWPTN
jgi:hypothetical protein